MSGGGCDPVMARLEAVGDRSLPPLEQARADEHAAACAPCSAALERHRAWLRDLRAHLAPGAAELAASRVGLEPRLAAARAPRALDRCVVTAAAAAAAALLALLALRGLELDVAELLASASTFERLDGWPRLGALLGI
jgi:hypothetical protein